MKIKIGMDGIYMVFENTDDAWEYHNLYGGCVGCFGGYENSVLLQDGIGM